MCEMPGAAAGRVSCEVASISEDEVKGLASNKRTYVVFLVHDSGAGIVHVRPPNLAEFPLQGPRSARKPKTELPGDFARIAVADTLR